MASFDSILLLTSILLFVVPSIYAYSGIGEFYYRHIHPLITPYTFVLGMTAQTSSGNWISLNTMGSMNSVMDWGPFVLSIKSDNPSFANFSIPNANRDSRTLHRCLPSPESPIVVHLPSWSTGRFHHRIVFTLLQSTSFLRSGTLPLCGYGHGRILDHGT